MQVKCSPYKYLQIPDFVLQTPDFILQIPDFRAYKKSANFFGGGFDQASRLVHSAIRLNRQARLCFAPTVVGQCFEAQRSQSVERS
jgi:hypothetical protein